MGVVLSAEVGDDSPVGVPLIGWHNIVTTSNIDTTTEATGFPATNMANPATHLKWVGGVNTGSEVITITTGTTEEISYIAVAGHNWGTLAVPISINAGAPAPTTLLHLDSTFADSATSPHTWTAGGGAAISAAQSVFLSAGSASFDGVNDLLTGDGSSAFAFGTGDFTIDFWIRWTAVGGSSRVVYDGRSGAEGAQPNIYTNSTSKLIYKVSSSDRITGTTTVVINTWYHVAITRSGTSTKMFLNGAQEGSTYSDSTNYTNPAGRPLIAQDGNIGGGNSAIFIDELRIIKGAAAWTANFTVPSSAYSASGSGQISTTLTSDDPVIFRFAPASLSTITITLAASGTEPPEAAVIYVGSLLVLERSITIGRGHVPITYGRRSNIVNGMSESGNFLGRIVLGEHRESKAEFEWFTPDFYRSDIDEFLAAAQETPFFWAWSPDEYPDEVGYVWLVNNVEPEVDPVTQRIALELQMRGIA